MSDHQTLHLEEMTRLRDVCPHCDRYDIQMERAVVILQILLAELSTTSLPKLRPAPSSIQSANRGIYFDILTWHEMFGHEGTLYVHHNDPQSAENFARNSVRQVYSKFAYLRLKPYETVLSPEYDCAVTYFGRLEDAPPEADRTYVVKFKVFKRADGYQEPELSAPKTRRTRQKKEPAPSRETCPHCGRSNLDIDRDVDALKLLLEGISNTRITGILRLKNYSSLDVERYDTEVQHKMFGNGGTVLIRSKDANLIREYTLKTIDVVLELFKRLASPLHGCAAMNVSFGKSSRSEGGYIAWVDFKVYRIADGYPEPEKWYDVP